MQCSKIHSVHYITDGAVIVQHCKLLTMHKCGLTFKATLKLSHEIDHFLVSDIIMDDVYDVDILDDACNICLLYTSPSPRDRQKSRMPSSA